MTMLRLSTTAALIGLLTSAFTACSARPRVIDIHAINYAFQAPTSTPPGLVQFRLLNEGTVDHEVQLFRFRPGITGAAAASLLRGASFPDSAYAGSGGVLIAPAGQTAHETLVVPLVAGEVYGLRCEFRDSASLPAHSQMGMWAVLEVH